MTAFGHWHSLTQGCISEVSDQGQERFQHTAAKHRPLGVLSLRPQNFPPGQNFLPPAILGLRTWLPISLAMNLAWIQGYLFPWRKRVGRLLSGLGRVHSWRRGDSLVHAKSGNRD